MIYTLTSIYQSDNIHRSGDTRCFGYFCSLADAIRAAEENRCDMQECRYNYLVVEKLGEGIHAMATAIKWYKWNFEKNCWEYTQAPEWSIDVCNYSIG